MLKKYFDGTGKEIKPGMSIWFGSETVGNCIPVVLYEGRMCFDNGFNEYIPLDDIDLSNCIIEYDPEENA